MDVQFPLTRTEDVNGLFRSAQADYMKQKQRQHIPVSYVGFKDISTPCTIKLAIIYDSQRILDEDLARGLEQTINRKIDDEYEPAEVLCKGESILLAQSSYDQAFHQASSIAQVNVRKASERRRVLFSSK